MGEVSSVSCKIEPILVISTGEELPLANQHKTGESGLVDSCWQIKLPCCEPTDRQLLLPMNLVAKLKNLWSSRSVVSTIGIPNVLGLKLPVTLIIRCAGQDFWEL